MVLRRSWYRTPEWLVFQVYLLPFNTALHPFYRAIAAASNEEQAEASTTRTEREHGGYLAD